MYHVIIEPTQPNLTVYHNDLRFDMLLKLMLDELGVKSCHFVNKVVDGNSSIVMWVTTSREDIMTKLTQLGRQYGQELVWVFSTDTTAPELIGKFAGVDDKLPVKALAVDCSAIILCFDSWCQAASLHIHANAPDCTYYQFSDTIITIPTELEERASLFLGLDIAWSVSDDEDDYYGDRA